MADDQQQSSNENSEASCSQNTHRFNLRDRKKICYNKKYGGFVFYKNDDDIQVEEGLEEDEEMPMTS